MTIAVGLGFCMALYALTVFVSLMVYFFPVAGKEERRGGSVGLPSLAPGIQQGRLPPAGPVLRPRACVRWSTIRTA